MKRNKFSISLEKKSIKSLDLVKKVGQSHTLIWIDS